MINLYEGLKMIPSLSRQLDCRGLLFTNYECPQPDEMERFFVERHFIAYVLRGRRIFHKNRASWELKEGACVFVKKGTHIAEKPEDEEWCVMVFFMPAVQRKLGIAEALVKSGRGYLHATLIEKWDKILAGEKLSMQDKADLLLASAHTNQSCSQAVDLMYSSAGTTAIYTRNKLEQYFRDAQVIRQHGFANESRYETAAQVYLGLQPDLPLLAF